MKSFPHKNQHRNPLKFSRKSTLAAATAVGGLVLAFLPLSASAAGPQAAAADTRASAAAAGLMTMYDSDTALFDGNGWWTSANAVTSLIDHMRVSGDSGYESVVSEIHDRNIDAQGGNFTNEYLDDTGWWGLAWVDAYDQTGDTKYLDTARADADHMAEYWNDQCGGGVQWNETKAYKNAITNELYLQLTAALHNRIDGDTQYLDRAKAEWNWFSGSGMINGSKMINDGLGDDCANNGQTAWTYNQGVVLGGLTELARATGDNGYLDTARELADASTTSGDITADGVLREPGEGECSGDGASFKGAYVRGLGALNSRLDDHPYTGWLDRNADAAYANDRTDQDIYGSHWNGPLTSSNHSCQHSALDLLNAATQK
ncbi:glycoside hydrolase family 76 protein [Streptomyces sp. NPDC049954]|uniref:glycoside hydrolase family 76 protein n=1 Tax=Streptomyces sp. NPDC049954 TaxID=3155779 RepID=UPI00342A506E